MEPWKERVCSGAFIVRPIELRKVTGGLRLILGREPEAGEVIVCTTGGPALGEKSGEAKPNIEDRGRVHGLGELNGGAVVLAGEGAITGSVRDVDGGIGGILEAAR